MADAGFGGGVRIGGGGEPGAFIDEAFKTAGPLVAEFVDVVAAHLVDDEEDDEFGAAGRERWMRARAWIVGFAGGVCAGVCADDGRERGAMKEAARRRLRKQ